MLSRFSLINSRSWTQAKSLLCHHQDHQKNWIKILSTTNRVNFSEHSTRPDDPLSSDKSPTNSNVISNYIQKFNQNPYVRLARADKPIGAWLLLWPCGWSIALASDPGYFPDIKTLAIFTVGAFVMRGAGCTINDMIDRKYDEKVTRTLNRPLVTGEISIFDAWFFLGAQLGIGLEVLLSLNNYCLMMGCMSIIPLSIYPLMKRVTYWPQFVLGLVFNWGVFMGYAAVQNEVYWEACLPLYMAGVSWTIIYDTIYAFQDRADDLRIGVKSTAIRFSNNPKLWLSGFSAVMGSSLIATGVACELAWPYYAATSLVMAHIGNQIYTLKVDDSKDCAKKFISNHRVGFLLFGGIMLGVLMQNSDDEDESVNRIDLMSLTEQTLPVNQIKL